MPPHNLRSTMAGNSLHGNLDRTLHFRMRQVFSALVVIATVLIILSWILRLSFGPIFPEKEVTSADTLLTFPSFDTLDKLRRPKLNTENYTLFNFTFPSAMAIVTMWIIRRMNDDPLSQDDFKSEEELQKELEGPVPDSNEVWHTLHVRSWRGYSPEHAICAIENTWTRMQSMYAVNLASSPVPSISLRIKTGLNAAWVGLWTVVMLALGVAVPWILVRRAGYLLEEPQCRLYSELFSSSLTTSSSLLLNVQEPLFPDSTVAVLEDGQVVVNGTILYTQGMDRALFTICSMESAAFFVGGWVGLMLAYQIILRWCWFGANIIWKGRRGGVAEDEKSAKEM